MFLITLNEINPSGEETGNQVLLNPTNVTCIRNFMHGSSITISLLRFDILVKQTPQEILNLIESPQ